VALPASLLLLGVQVAALTGRHDAAATRVRVPALPATGALHDVTQQVHAAAATPGAGGTGDSAPPVTFTVATLAASASAVDPRLAVAGDGTVYVTAANGLLGHLASGQSASPVWVSNTGGGDFDGPFATETAPLTPAGLGGVASDITVDGRGNAYVITDWTGNSSASVSADHGRTWQQLPYAHPVPIGNRPWLDAARVGVNPLGLTDPGDGALYLTWDGVGGVHAAKALLRPVSDGAASLLFAQDTIAVPEEPHPGVNQYVDQSSLRECICPTGPLAAMPGTSTLWFAYPSQNGVAVAVSIDGGVDWFAPAAGGEQLLIPAGVPGDPQSVANGYPVAAGDARQDAYVVWGQYDSAGSYGLAYAVASFSGMSCPLYGGLPDAGPSTNPLSPGVGCFSNPISIPTPPTAIFATAATVSPGVLDVAYVAAEDYRGNPATAPAGTQWNLYLAQADAANDPLFGRTFATVEVLPDIHRGPICVQPGVAGTACPTTAADATSTPTSLGSLISMRIDASGLAVIAAASDHGGHHVVVAHQTADPTFGLTALQHAARQDVSTPEDTAAFLQQWCASHPGRCNSGPAAGASSRAAASAAPQVGTGTGPSTPPTPRAQARPSPPLGPWTVARAPAVPEHTQASPAVFAVVAVLVLLYLGVLATVTRIRRCGT
jgi:hypothetical protein